MTQTPALWNELLDEFRTLGGIAENVRRGIGSHGAGIFPVDPAREVALRVPENLLVPPQDLLVDAGRLAVRAASALHHRERSFFERLHLHFGWSAGAFDDLFASQRQWAQLPDDVVAFLKAMGALTDPELRFAAPSEELCLYRFVRSREIDYEGQMRIMPVVDFVNHSGGGRAFAIRNGAGVRGTYAGEVLVRYNVADPWANAMTYGFADDAPFAYSLSLTVELFGSARLSILRKIGSAEVQDGIRYPHKRVEGNTIELSFVDLGNVRQPDLPRGIFRRLLRDHLTERQADDVFESIARFNHSKFIEALRLLRKHDAPLVRVLEEAAIAQLDALSASVGARSL